MKKTGLEKSNQVKRIESIRESSKRAFDQVRNETLTALYEAESLDNKQESISMLESIIDEINSHYQAVSLLLGTLQQGKIDFQTRG
ncbi:MAG: hypothetical protein PHR06_10495 [Candidatus Cloacimonetes bacterium]|nr:hypothetical protein [Candidatus Cloacimonadota bacterium]